MAKLKPKLKAAVVREGLTEDGSVFRAPLKFQEQLIGQPDQASLFSRVLPKERADEFVVIGIDAEPSDHRAFEAIQKLFDKTAWRGNSSGFYAPVEERDRWYLNDALFIPILECSRPEYYDAYGLKKRRTKRGKLEYSAWETQEADRALERASQKKFLFIRRRRKDGRVETTVDTAFALTLVWGSDLTIGELKNIVRLNRMARERRKSGDSVTVSEGKTSAGGRAVSVAIKQDETDEVAATVTPSKKHLGYKLTPRVIMAEGMHGRSPRFVLKSTDTRYEVQKLLGKRARGGRSKYIYNFINVLDVESRTFLLREQHRKPDAPPVDWTLHEPPYELACHLRMDSLVQPRFRRAQAIGRQKELIADLHTLGYLLDAPKKPNAWGAWVLKLNAEKFRERKRLDDLRKLAER